MAKKSKSAAKERAEWVKRVSALDKIRHEHYGDIPLNVRELKAADRLLKFPLGNHPVAKSLRKKYPLEEICKELSSPVIRRKLLLYLQACKLTNGDREALKFEYELLENDFEREFFSRAAQVVELGEETVEKLARATGAAVKKAVKPGRGATNVRFPDETKKQCLKIWKSKEYREAAKQHVANGVKITHEAVFEVAKNKLTKLQPMPIATIDDFKRALGAASDKAHRESAAMKKKPQ